MLGVNVDDCILGFAALSMRGHQEKRVTACSWHLLLHAVGCASGDSLFLVATPWKLLELEGLVHQPHSSCMHAAGSQCVQSVFICWMARDCFC